MVSAQQRHRVRGCDNQSPHHLCDKLCDYASVRMCLNDMFCISLPPEGSFSARYTVTLTGVLICKQRQDKCMCHSPPHGIPSSHTRGQEVRNGVMTTNCTIQVKWQRGLWKPLEASESSGPLKQLLTCTVYYSAMTVEKISLGQLHLLSQGDVKEPESCLSEALLTADLCVFSHLSC